MTHIRPSEARFGPLNLGLKSFAFMHVLRGTTALSIAQIFEKRAGINLSITDKINKGWNFISKTITPYFGAEAKDPVVSPKTADTASQTINQVTGKQSNTFSEKVTQTVFGKETVKPMEANASILSEAKESAVKTINSWTNTFSEYMPQSVKGVYNTGLDCTKRVWEIGCDNSDWLVPGVGLAILFAGANHLLSKKIENEGQRNFASFTLSAITVWSASILLNQAGVNHTVTLSKVIDLGVKMFVVSKLVQFGTPKLQTSIDFFNRRVLDLFNAPFAYQVKTKTE